MRAALNPAGTGADLWRFAVAVLPTGAAALLQLVVFVLTGRALGPEAFGLVAAAYAVAAVAGDVVGLGADGAMVRGVAVEPARFPAAWGHALSMLGLSYAPVALAATAVATVLAPGLGLGTVACLVAGEVLVGRATAAAEIAYVARGRPVAAAQARLAAVAARALVAVLVFGVVGSTDPSLWAAATCGQSAATAAALLWVAGRGRPTLAFDAGAVRFGLLLMLNQVARSLVANLDRMVLAMLLAPATLGIYAGGTRLLLVGAVANQAATRILYPRFFRAADAGSAALAAQVRTAAATMALVGCLSAAAIATVGPLLPLLLGPGFAGVGRVAAALGLACPFVALQYPAADALTAGGRQPLRTRVYLGGAATASLLLAAGALTAGLWGAVAGLVVGQAALAAALWLALRWSAR